MRRLVWRVAGALAAAVLATGPAAAQRPGPNPLAARPAPLVYVMEQLLTGPITPAVLERMKPLDTLQQVEDLLKAETISFVWRRTEIGAEAIPPALAQQIAVLQPKAVFVLPQPQGKGWVMSVVIEQR